MKRLAVRICVLLLLGAIVNVAVAWGDGVPMRLRRNANSHPPFWLFSDFSMFGWPTATVEGLDAFKPIWPGFAFNTVFYAAVLWMLFAVSCALRKRRRIKRGLCPKCAYPRGAGTNQVCTECGAALPVSASAR